MLFSFMKDLWNFNVFSTSQSEISFKICSRFPSKGLQKHFLWCCFSYLKGRLSPLRETIPWFSSIYKKKRATFAGRSIFVIQSYNIFRQNPNLTVFHLWWFLLKMGLLFSKIAFCFLTYINSHLHGFTTKDESEWKHFFMRIIRLRGHG